jgi:rod shape-determining protein MreC
MIVRLDSQRNRTVLMVIGLCAVALGLDAWQRVARRAGAATPFDNVVCAVSAPLQTALLEGARFAENEWLAMFRARELAKENARLAAHVAALEDRLSTMGETRAAAKRGQALRSAYPIGGRGRVARVIGVGSGGWSDYLTLDVGSSLGVRAKQSVVAREGLVGQVYAVSFQACRVIPLTAPASSVAVRLERSREGGVLKGLGDWRCEIRYLDPAADVRIGDRVITSGLGGVYPKGLRVGTVTAVRPDEYTPGKVAEVEPAAPLRRTEEVLLLRGQ